MAQHIGIVACSAEGAALCYRTICVEGAEVAGRHGHPEVSMHTFSLAQYMEPIYRQDWTEVGNLMLASAAKLASIGADFVICPDNTIHQALPSIESQLPLPWLHIADVVAEEAVRRGFRRLGLTGTRYLVESDVYPDRLTRRGIDYLRPAIADREECNRIIFDELVSGVFTKQSVVSFEQVIERLKGDGCDAVVLGCTEIPLIIDDANSPLPTLDSTRCWRAPRCVALTRPGRGRALRCGWSIGIGVAPVKHHDGQHRSRTRGSGRATWTAREEAGAVEPTGFRTPEGRARRHTHRADREGASLEEQSVDGRWLRRRVRVDAVLRLPVVPDRTQSDPCLEHAARQAAAAS